MTHRTNRRRFLQTSAAAASVPFLLPSMPTLADDAKSESKNDRPLVGSIGTGSRWRGVGSNAMKYADIVAVCDVDGKHLEGGQNAVKRRQKKTPTPYSDYRKLLERKDIDIVTIVTPDHWHTKIAIEALRAGKDVYCEKPMTLTIDEGKKICQVVKETGRIFQVGTQQRSEMGLRFLNAVALIKAGRIGEVKKVTVAIGGAPKSGPLKTETPPAHLDWEMWQGQTELTDYIKLRCHYQFRWWYEYSGGKMTDWGAHHVDIATWAIGMDKTGPVSVEPLKVTHPVEFKGGFPTDKNQYNTATEFDVKCTFGNGIVMHIRHQAKDLGFDNGIMFEGTKGRLFVNRGKLTGKAVGEMKANPLPEGLVKKLYKGKQPGDHMRNFVECTKSRSEPVSDVFTHHRALTTCHLANIAIRLNRTLRWDAKNEQVVGDSEANGWQKRKQRKGFEI